MEGKRVDDFFLMFDLRTFMAVLVGLTLLAFFRGNLLNWHDRFLHLLIELCVLL